MRSGGKRCLGIVLVWLPAWVLPGCSSDPVADSVKPRTVTVAPAIAIERAPTIVVPGVVRPARRAVLSTRTSGNVRTLFVNAGDRVSAGQPLVEIESRDLEAAVAAAEESRDGALRALQKARRDADRLERLYAQDLIARARLEDARLLRARREGELAAAEAELQARQVTLQYARLRAPFAGMASEVLVDAGAFVAPGTPLVVLDARKGLEIDASIGQSIADRLAPGQTLSFRLPGNGRQFAGSLQAVIPAMHGRGVGSRIRIILEGAEPALRPGQVVEIEVPEARPAESLLRIPSAAIFHSGQLTGVFVLARSEAAEIARLRWVELAGADEGHSAHRLVRSGLKAGEQVVLGEAVHHLDDGQAIRSVRRGNGPDPDG